MQTPKDKFRVEIAYDPYDGYTLYHDALGVASGLDRGEMLAVVSCLACGVQTPPYFRPPAVRAVAEADAVARSRGLVIGRTYRVDGVTSPHHGFAGELARVDGACCYLSDGEGPERCVGAKDVVEVEVGSTGNRPNPGDIQVGEEAVGVAAGIAAAPTAPANVTDRRFYLFDNPSLPGWHGMAVTCEGFADDRTYARVFKVDGESRVLRKIDLKPRP